MSGTVATRYSSIPMRRRILAGEIPEMIRKHKRREYILACYRSMPEWCDRADMRPHRAVEYGSGDAEIECQIQQLLRLARTARAVRTAAARV